MRAPRSLRQLTRSQAPACVGTFDEVAACVHPLRPRARLASKRAVGLARAPWRLPSRQPHKTPDSLIDLAANLPDIGFGDAGGPLAASVAVALRNRRRVGNAVGSRRSIAALLCAASMSSGCTAAFAAAPTLMRGTTQIITTGAFTAAKPSNSPASHQSGRGKPWRKDEIEVLAEHGLFDGVTILFSPRLTVHSTNRFHGWESGEDATLAAAGKQRDLGGSARLGFRARLFGNQRDVVSVEVSGRGGALARDVASPVMTRAAEAEVRILWLRTFMLLDRPWFVDVQGGYRHVFESTPVAGSARKVATGAGEGLLDVTLGVHVSPRLMLLLQNFSVFPFGGAGPQTGDAHKLQASVAWKLNAAWTVQGGLLATYAGSSPWRERGIIIGVWRRFGS